MWMNSLLTLIGCVSIAALCGAVVALITARRAVAAARSVARLPQSFDSRLNALIERQDACEALLQKIDARDRMRKVRAGRVDSDTAADPWKDPDGWKTAMRARRAKET